MLCVCVVCRTKRIKQKQIRVVLDRRQQIHQSKLPSNRSMLICCQNVYSLCVLLFFTDMAKSEVRLRIFFSLTFVSTIFFRCLSVRALLPQKIFSSAKLLQFFTIPNCCLRINWKELGTVKLSLVALGPLGKRSKIVEKK